MFSTISHFLNALVFLDLTLAILCCILLIKLPIRYGIKYLVIPIIVLTTYMLVIEGEGFIGRPYDKMPVGKFEFMDYRVVTSGGQKTIEIWVLQNKKSRLHVIPYMETTEKELAKAKSAGKQGRRSQGEFQKSGKPSKGMSEGADQLRMEEVPLSAILPPKDDDDEGSAENVR